MADLRIVDAPVLLQESITDDVKMPTGGLGNFSIRLGDIVWYVVTKEQLANKSYVDLSSKGVKDSLDAHIANKENPHQVTKAQVGLGNVDNTADVDKPVSNATKSAIITATNDMATKAYVNQQDNLKADKASTLSGYGIADAYTKTEADNKINALSGTTYAGHKGYLTLADAQAAQASLPANTLVEVTNDTKASNNGVYLWDGTALTKSAYDPALQAKTYADSNPLFKPVSINNTPTVSVDLNSSEYQNGYFLFTLTPKPQVHLNFPYYGNDAGTRGAGALIAVKEPNGTFARQLFITPDNVYFRATTSGAFEDWKKLATSQEIGNLISEEDLKKELNQASGDVEKDIFNELGVSFPREYIYSNYETGSLLGNSTNSPSSFSTSNATSRSKIFKVEPNTLYTVAKKSSNKFRIAEFSDYPINGAKPIYFTKDEYVSSTKDGDVDYFTFTTQQTTSYIVVYVSNTSEEPVLYCYAGEYIAFQENVIIDKPVEINGEVNLKAGLRVSGEFTSRNIVKGKNLFKGDEYLEGNIVLSGPVGTGRSINVGKTTVNAKTAILKINPNTTYTVSKSASDRFRIGLCDVKPTLGTANIEIIAGESNDSSSQFTFTSKNTTNYLVLYLAANTAAPSEVQVEEGKTATEYESFGYKFSPAATPKNKGSSSGTAAYDNAGVGDANYISKDSATAGAWKDSQYTIPATDDTDTLQALFDSAKGVVSLEPGKKYKVTRPIIYNPERVKLIKGNMAHIVCIGDIETFQMVGTLSSSANADGLNRSLAYNEMSPMVVALKITNPMEVLGTAFVVNKVMSPIFLACNFAYLRRGIVFRGNNRNAILSSNHIYACSDYGIHFEEGGELHQINIVGNHISYCRKNIFSENHNIYNIQITGGDIETSSYPTLEIGGAAECDMHFLQTTAILEDLEIVGNTIEDHWNTTKMIRLEGNPTTTDKISCVTISGNVTGNSAGSVIEIGGASGVEIVGQFKANLGYVVDVIGNLNGFKLSTQSKQKGGGLFRAVGGYSLKDVTVCGNNLSNSVTQNPILVDVQSLDNCNFSDNDLRVSGVGGFHTTHKAPITIHADTMKLVRVDDNTIANTSSTTKAVEVVARNSSEKGSMRGNMASYGAFTAPGSFAISENA